MKIVSVILILLISTANFSKAADDRHFYSISDNPKARGPVVRLGDDPKNPNNVLVSKDGATPLSVQKNLLMPTIECHEFRGECLNEDRILKVKDGKFAKIVRVYKGGYLEVNKGEIIKDRTGEKLRFGSLLAPGFTVITSKDIQAYGNPWSYPRVDIETPKGESGSGWSIVIQFSDNTILVQRDEYVVDSDVTRQTLLVPTENVVIKKGKERSKGEKTHQAK